MSRHPHAVRWADAEAGRLSAGERAHLEAHAAACATCRQARARVRAARVAMSELAASPTPSPELPWDSIRAKVRWELSPAGTTGRLPVASRAGHRGLGLARLGAALGGMPGWAWWGAASLVATASAAILHFAGPGESREAPPVMVGHLTTPAAPAAPAAALAPAPAAPAPLIGLVTRTRGAVQLDGDAQRLFERPVHAGAVLASGLGWMDVQLGEGSALTLGPRSSLRVDRFDAAVIELSIDGLVDVEVAPRAAGQRFLVRAGAQTVEVRGTQFRVEHRADETRVSCRHGAVVVSEGPRSREVAAGQKVAVLTGQPMPAAAPLSATERIELALATPYRVPWDDAAAVAASTARLELIAPAERRLRLDGVDLGAGSLEVRVGRGRHLVETAPAGGAFRRAGWAVVGAQAEAVRFEAETTADAPPSSSASYRRLFELRARLSRGKLARCVRPLAKQGLAETFVRVELFVDRDGSVSYLNILDTDLPTELAECVRAVVADVRFVAGPAAKVVEKIEL